jgi:hypothetical protein
MSWTKADFLLAEEHVRQAEAMIARQEKILSDLRMDGHSTDDAESLLYAMRDSLRVFRKHRDMIAQDLAKQ